MPLVMYQPDFPPNLGAFMRLAVCFGVPLHVIEPCGFAFDDRRVKLRSLDYGDQVELIRHASWEVFETTLKSIGGRLILATTKTSLALYDFHFQPEDWLLFGSESAGVPEYIHTCSDARVKIPMPKNARSFNVGMAAAIVLSEAYRQHAYPSPT